MRQEPFEWWVSNWKVLRVGLDIMLIVAFASVFSGCSQPKMEPIPVKTMPEFKYHTNSDGLEIAVDPYSDPGRVKKHFGKNLHTDQILPVQVAIRNAERQGGFVLQPELTVFLGEADSEIESGRGYPNVPPQTSLAPSLLTTVAPAIPAALLLAVPMGAINWDAHSDAQEICRHMDSLRFRDRPLYPSDSNRGFLFFKFTDSSSLQEVAAVRFRVKNINSEEEFVIVVPVRDN